MKKTDTDLSTTDILFNKALVSNEVKPYDVDKLFPVIFI